MDPSRLTLIRKLIQYTFFKHKWPGKVLKYGYTVLETKNSSPKLVNLVLIYYVQHCSR